MDHELSNNIIVVKIEYTTLSYPDGTLNTDRMDRMAMILSNIHNSGKKLLLVSSGAIALGTKILNLKAPPKTHVEKQSTAAVGQAELIKLYQNYFESYNQRVAQVLITKDVMDNKVRMTNAKNTFRTLLQMDIIPVINENDTVSTDDIEWNDNYPLTYNVAQLSLAGIIVIKSEHEGHYYIVTKPTKKACLIDNEENLIGMVEHYLLQANENKYRDLNFPRSINEIVFN